MRPWATEMTAALRSSEQMTQAPQGRLRKGSKNSNSPELSQAKKEIRKASGEMRTRKRSYNVVGTPERTCGTGVSQVPEQLCVRPGCEGPCLGPGLLGVLHKALVPDKIEHLGLMVNQLSTLLIQWTEFTSKARLP